MRILHVIASVDPRGGGPIEGIVQQSAYRRSASIETEIATLDRPDDPWVETCPVPVIPLGVKAPAYRTLRRVLPWLRYGYTPHLVPWLKTHAREYDVVVVNGLWNYTALAARRALTGSDTPYVVFTHGMLDPWFRKSAPIKTMVKQIVWWFAEGPLLAGAEAVLFTSEEERRLARDAFWPYRVRERVIGYGTSDIRGDAARQIEAFRAKVPGLAGRPYLLFLSRIHPKKGCDLLVDAFAEAAHAHPEIDLVIAGPDQAGWRAELETQAAARGVASRIHWPGMLEGDAKWGAFRSCEAFVLPSHQENFGIVVAEAMAAGRPVLITDKVNIWQEVQQDGGGLVEDDTPAGIRRLLTRFLELGQAARDAMGVSSRRCFLDRYDLAKTSEDTMLALQAASASGLRGRIAA